MADRLLLRDIEQLEQALFECAQAAWASKGTGYNLVGWQLHSLTAVVGYGYPPRAKKEYQHVFLFEKDRQGVYHLRTVGKGPSDRSLGWWGLCLTDKRTFVDCFSPGLWTCTP